MEERTRRWQGTVTMVAVDRSRFFAEVIDDETSLLMEVSLPMTLLRPDHAEKLRIGANVDVTRVDDKIVMVEVLK